MHQSPEPQPLTRLNVTKHDRIWDKELPKGFFGFDSSNTLFSPPLKHITPETAEELWEKFDPLDLLIDCASEKSVKSESSSDTMIMMTTEELKKNEERIKSSFKEYEHRKNLKSSQMNQTSQGYESHDFVVEQSDFRNNNSHKSTEEDFLNDEGYGTDSRTNTTASLSSPLSSSLSSLLTSESSSSQGSMQRNLNGNSRPQQISSNGRLVVGHRQNVVAKKKVQPAEKQDNSLMEKLRALTTIQEEDAAPSTNDNAPVGNHTVSRKNDPRIVYDQRRSSDYGTEHGRYIENPRSYTNDQGGSCRNDSYGSEQGRYVNEPRHQEQRYDSDGGRPGADQSGHSKTTYLNDTNMFVDDATRPVHDGIFRAIPVKIGQRNSVSQMENIPVNGTVPLRRSDFDRPEPNSRFWNGDVPHSDSRLRTGDSVDSTSGEVTPQKLSKHHSHMYSMPNLSANPHTLPQQDQVVMRRPKPQNSNFRNPPKHDQRYSWDCSSDVRQVPSKFDVDSRNFTNSYPVKCEEPPKLSNQFRASSEMALQNGRPLFATSSDIYKLFQGQGRSGFGQGKQASHRHSFHAMPSQTNFSMQPSDPSMEDMRNKLRAASSHRAASPTRVKGGPVRASHDLYKDLPHQANNHKVRPSSMTESKDKLSTLV